ncbi:MAG: serine/threonine-protein kinase, partial [Acidobacteria bacterium]|nr:serine/threonine-protein kinase [Acidobacteriota bacterium]
MPGLHGGLRLNARFTLVRSIGTGGMGEVWVVEDRELDEEIAAKILPPGTPEDLVALLRRECSNARRLLHPNIVPVFDFHRGDDGHSFITMARVDGQDAGSLRGRPVAGILTLAVPLAAALAYAHGIGVVHRDLKVGNVLVDADGQPRLIDFGIAAILGEQAEPRGGGSRYNVSPQQLSGEAAQIADDLYGFGVLLYELFSGQPPLWPDPTADRILSERPAPLTSAHPVPPRLQALVAALLEKSPARRPADMDAV